MNQQNILIKLSPGFGSLVAVILETNTQQTVVPWDKVSVAGKLMVLRWVWVSFFPLIASLEPLWLFPPTGSHTCARIFRHSSLALFSLEKIIISQWPVCPIWKTLIHCRSTFIHPEVWGCLGERDEWRKGSFDILCTNLRTILGQIKPLDSLWLCYVQGSSTWLLGDWPEDLFI